MASETTNYKLVKPDPEEFYDIGVQNSNLDKIDTALKELEDSKASNVNLISLEQTVNSSEEKITSFLAESASKFTNINLNIIDMAVELETLKGATLNGVTANIFIETFQNLDDINLMNGVYDNINKRLVL